MDDKIKLKPKKYKDSKLVRVFIIRDIDNIGVEEYDVPGVGGALGISVMSYFITKENKVHRYPGDPAATFWYNDQQLATRKFSLDDIKLKAQIDV